MKLKVKVDAGSGAAYIAAIDPSTGEHRKSTTATPGQEVELGLPGVTDVSGIKFGEPVSSEAEAPAEEPQEGQEQPQGGEGGGEQPAVQAAQPADTPSA